MSSKSQRCVRCHKTAYPLETVMVDGIAYHKQCFRCLSCDSKLTMNGYAMINMDAYCKPHYMQMFQQSGGRYDRAFGSNFNNSADPKPAPLSPTSAPLSPTSASSTSSSEPRKSSRSTAKKENIRRSSSLEKDSSERTKPNKSPSRKKRKSPKSLKKSKSPKSPKSRSSKRAQRHLNIIDDHDVSGRSSDPNAVRHRKRNVPKLVTPESPKSSPAPEKRQNQHAVLRKLPILSPEITPPSPARQSRKTRMSSPTSMKRSKHRHRSESPPKQRKKPQLPQRNHTGVRCQICQKTAVANESIRVDNGIFHKVCFRCNVCHKQLTLTGFVLSESLLFCKPHFQKKFERSPGTPKSDSAKSPKIQLSRPAGRAQTAPDSPHKTRHDDKSKKQLSLPNSPAMKIYVSDHQHSEITRSSSLSHDENTMKTHDENLVTSYKTPPPRRRRSSAHTYLIVSEGQCQLCFAKINENGVKADEKVFHKDCFKCLKCKTELNGDNFRVGELGPYCLDHSVRTPQTVSFLEPPDVKRKNQERSDSFDTMGHAVPKSLPYLEVADRDPSDIPTRIAEPDPKIISELNKLTKQNKILQVKNKTLEKEKTRHETQSKSTMKDNVYLKQKCEEHELRANELSEKLQGKNRLIKKLQARAETQSEKEMKKEDSTHSKVLMAQIKEKDGIILRHTTHLEKLNDFIASQKSRVIEIEAKLELSEGSQLKFNQEISMLKQQRSHMSTLIREKEQENLRLKEQNDNLKANVEEFEAQLDAKNERKLSPRNVASPSSHNSNERILELEKQLDAAKTSLNTSNRHVEVLTVDQDRLSLELLASKKDAKEARAGLENARHAVESLQDQIKELQLSLKRSTRAENASRVSLRVDTGDTEEKQDIKTPTYKFSPSRQMSTNKSSEKVQKLDVTTSSFVDKNESRSPTGSQNSLNSTRSEPGGSKSRKYFRRKSQNQITSFLKDDSEFNQQSKEVDEYLAEYLSSTSKYSDVLHRLQLEKVDHDTLLFGTKKIIIRVVENQLSVRTYVPFDAYVEKYGSSEIKKLENRKSKSLKLRRDKKKRPSLFPLMRSMSARKVSDPH